jgi:toxin CcdB
MARHDVYNNPKGGGLILDVQNDILEIIGSRVVIPLVPKDKFPKLTSRLNPEFNIGDRQYVMLTQQIAAFPAAALGTPLASLKQHDFAITNALDMLFQGF